MPRPEDLHIDAAVSGFALDFSQTLEMIGPLVAPVLNVQKQSDLYWVADKKNRVQEIGRAPGDVYKTVDWGYSKEPFLCKGYGAKALVPKELEANADPQVDPAEDAVAAVVDTVMVNAEKRIADKAFSATFMTNTSALAGTARWDSTAPDPWANRKTANASIRAKTGRKANTLVLGDLVWECLRDMTTIKAAIYGQGPKGVPSTDQVANVLGLDRIIVGSGSYFDEASEQFVDLWGKSALFAYYPGSVSENQGRIVVPMRTVVWNVEGVGRFQVSAPFEDRDRKSTARYVDDYTDELITCVDAAYLFTTAIS